MNPTRPTDTGFRITNKRIVMSTDGRHPILQLAPHAKYWHSITNFYPKTGSKKACSIYSSHSKEESNTRTTTAPDSRGHTEQLIESAAPTATQPVGWQPAMWVLFENRPALHFCNYIFITAHKLYNFGFRIKDTV